MLTMRCDAASRFLWMPGELYQRRAVAQLRHATHWVCCGDGGGWTGFDLQLEQHESS